MKILKEIPAVTEVVTPGKSIVDQIYEIKPGSLVVAIVPSNGWIYDGLLRTGVGGWMPIRPRGLLPGRGMAGYAHREDIPIWVEEMTRAGYDIAVIHNSQEV